MGAIYFELAQGSSMRLCLKLEDAFPELRGWQLELMKQLCFVAYNSEIYDGVGHDAWLRTTVSLPELQSECDSLDPFIFSEGSVERDVMARIAAHSCTNAACQTYWSKLQELHLELTARVKIHSNIVPREAYREKLLQKLRQRGPSGRLTFRREFYPTRVLADAVEEEKSASEKTKEWRMNGGRCALAMHLRSSHVPHALPMDRLRDVEQTQVSTSLETLGSGVCKVSWRNGIYARKSFELLPSFEKERDVALRVSHPHIVRPIGQTSDAQGHPCLLMEVLGNNLHRLAIEKDFAPCVASLFLGHVDSLDVLLQIAMGMKSLHDTNVVHGDLKPQNILFSHFEISEDVQHFLVKIADFDHAQFIVPGEAFKPKPGTTMYAAPEVLKWTRLKVQDVPFSDPEKLDIYSFGSVAYEVLTGQAVYDGKGLGRRDDIKRVVEGKLPPHGSIEPLLFCNGGYSVTSAMATCFNKLRKFIVWQRIKMIYPCELIHCLESCWALNPSERPSSSQLCEVLQRSKSEMQLLERKRAYVLWNFHVPCLIAFMCTFATSYIHSVEFWNRLVNLVVEIAVVTLIGFVCICYYNYSIIAQDLRALKTK